VLDRKSPCATTGRSLHTCSNYGSDKPHGKAKGNRGSDLESCITRREEPNARIEGQGSVPV
jgi:hypothetical protein